VYHGKSPSPLAKFNDLNRRQPIF